MKQRNPVAKHARAFNKAVVMANRKRQAKAGHVKHKQPALDARAAS
jgi:hypothetical protein